MNFIDPQLYSSKRAASASNVTLPVLPTTLLTNEPARDYTVFNFYDEGYSKNSLLLDLVTMRADAVKRAPIVLFDVKKPDEPIPYDDSIPLYKLLYNPHSDMDLESLLCVLESYRILGGEAYLYTKRIKGVIQSLLPYSTAFLNPIPNTDNAIDHYTFNNGQNDKVPIAKTDIIRFTWSTIDPKHPWKCPSPLLSCGLELDADYLRASLVYQLLKYGISPSYIITLGENHELDANNANRLSEQIQLRFSGKNQSRAAILHDGDTIQKLDNSINEFNGTELATLPETRLCDVLRIPIQMTSLKSAEGSKTYSNYQEAAKYYYKNIERVWIDFGKILTKFFYNETFPGDKRKYIIKFDVSNIEELHDSVDLQQDRWLSKFQGNTITLDEYREKIGLPPYEDETKGAMLFTEITRPPAPVAATQLRA